MSDILNDLVEQGKGTDFRDRYIRISYYNSVNDLLLV